MPSGGWAAPRWGIERGSGNGVRRRCAERRRIGPPTKIVRLLCQLPILHSAHRPTLHTAWFEAPAYPAGTSDRICLPAEQPPMIGCGTNTFTDPDAYRVN